METRIETYSGYRADERPLRFVWDGRVVEIREVLRRWREPGAEYFRVLGEDGLRYELRRGGDEWVVFRWNGLRGSAT